MNDEKFLEKVNADCNDLIKKVPMIRMVDVLGYLYSRLGLSLCPIEARDTMEINGTEYLIGDLVYIEGKLHARKGVEVTVETVYDPVEGSE